MEKKKTLEKLTHNGIQGRRKHLSTNQLVQILSSANISHSLLATPLLSLLFPGVTTTSSADLQLSLLFQPQDHNILPSSCLCALNSQCDSDVLVYSQINHSPALGSHNPSLIHAWPLLTTSQLFVPHSQHSSFHAPQSQFTTFFSPYRQKPAEVEHASHSAVSVPRSP